ncbi:MAG: uracil phosphoribosyltransferase [Bacteroidetes bacterium]|nr:uracil phosphoribosyltransferase [Bacteroidota bacterium]
MKNFFEAIAYLFDEVLFTPFEMLRNLELQNWWVANGASWLFLLIGFAAATYWTLQLKGFNDRGEEDKDPSAHSFL